MGIHLLPPLFKIIITPPVTELIIYAGDGDGYLIKTATPYASSHGAGSADSVDIASDTFAVGQFQVAGNWTIWRAGLPFDTSPIPPGAVITKAILSLYKQAHSYDVVDYPDLVVVDGSPIGAALDIADYGALLGEITSGGSISLPDTVTDAYNDIILDNYGRGLILKGGTTWLALRSSFDIGSYEKYGSISIYQANKGWKNPADHTQGYKPKLTVQYYIQ